MNRLPRLVAIELEGFRGFAQRQRLLLDAQAVIIRGDNGSGKTSLVDGLLWLFCGELKYLSERVRGLRRTEDAVTSRFNPSGARVRLEVRVGEQIQTFTRTGDERGTRLECLVDNEPVENAELALATAFDQIDQASLSNAVQTWGMLRQDAVRAALDVSGGALYERLASVIGLDRVTAFAAAATRTSDALIRERTSARDSEKRLMSRHGETAARLEDARRSASSPQEADRVLRRGMDALSAALSDRVLLRSNEPDLKELALVAQQLTRMIESLEVQQTRVVALGDRQQDTDAAVEAAERAMEAASRSAVVATQEAPVAAQLAVAALQMLGDRCPVCGQTIDEVTVREHLEEILEVSNRSAALAQEAQDAVARARTDLAEIRERARQRRNAEEALRAARLDVQKSVGDAGLLRVAEVPVDGPQLAELIASVRSALDLIRTIQADTQKAGGVVVERLQSQVDALALELATAHADVERLERRCAEAKTLERAAHRAAENIIERALDALQPSFAEVFERLNPNPAFTELLARQDVFRNRNQVIPVVRDLDRGIDANPVLVFSEGQLNVVALSYFLGMALNAHDAMLPFLVLDDPLQALDVVTILGFGDLCRRIRDARQLIVTTHDPRFADVLVRKLSPREPDGRTIVLEFEGWTRDGPAIRATEPELAEVIPLFERRAS